MIENPNVAVKRMNELDFSNKRLYELVNEDSNFGNSCILKMFVNEVSLDELD